MFFDLLNQMIKLPNEYVIIVDRSYLSLNIYDKVFNELNWIDNEAYKYLLINYLEKLNLFEINLRNSMHTTFNIILNPPEEITIDNIKERKRSDELKEADLDYLRKIYKEYSRRFQNNCFYPEYVNANNRVEMFKNLKQQVEEYIHNKIISEEERRVNV